MKIIYQIAFFWQVTIKPNKYVLLYKSWKIRKKYKENKASLENIADLKKKW